MIILQGSRHNYVDVGDGINNQFEGPTVICRDNVDVDTTRGGHVTDTSREMSESYAIICTDSAGNTDHIPITVSVGRSQFVDEPGGYEYSPSITIRGDNHATVPHGGTYRDAGAYCTRHSASMPPDPLSASRYPYMFTRGHVDTSIPGVYTITYECVDIARNYKVSHSTATRTVLVDPPSSPPSPTVSTQIDPAHTIEDIRNGLDTECRSGIEPTLGVHAYETTQRGQYLVTYTCTDTMGQVGIAYRLHDSAVTNHVLNPSFERPVTTGTYSNIPNSNAELVWSSSGGLVEIVRGGASDGSQYTELNVNNRTTISQTLAGTATGQDYAISFDYKKRAGTADTDNGLEVLWNGNVIPVPGFDHTITSWTTYTVDVQAAGNDVLAFRSASASDASVGTHLDNVSVRLAVDSILNSPPSSTGPVVLGAAAEIIDIGTTNDTITVQWTGPQDADSYDIMWWETATNGTSPDVATQSADFGTYYDITGLQPGTDYTIRVVPYVGPVRYDQYASSDKVVTTSPSPQGQPTSRMVADAEPRLPAGHPLAKYAALISDIKTEYILDHNDDTKHTKWKGVLKAMGDPDYADYPGDAMTSQDAALLYDANGWQRWAPVADAISYAESYYATQAGQSQQQQQLTLDAIADQTVDELQTLSVQASVTGGTATSYGTNATSLGASISTTGLFTWTPAEEHGPGAYAVSITASDGTSHVSASFAITVREVNSPPALQPIADLNATVGTQLAVTLQATDADLPANALTYGTNATVGTLAGSVWSWTPAAADAGTVRVITFDVSDGAGGTASRTVTVSVPAAATQTADGEMQSPLVKYAALIADIKDAYITDHDDDAAHPKWKRVLKAMGDPDYADYPRDAMTSQRAAELYDANGWDRWAPVADAIGYAESYYGR